MEQLELTELAIESNCFETFIVWRIRPIPPKPFGIQVDFLLGRSPPLHQRLNPGMPIGKPQLQYLDLRIQFAFLSLQRLHVAVVFGNLVD